MEASGLPSGTKFRASLNDATGRPALAAAWPRVAVHLGWFAAGAALAFVVPYLGNVLISVPALVTANPVGSIVDHAGMHIAAVAHEYEGDLRLPPQADAE